MPGSVRAVVVIARNVAKERKRRVGSWILCKQANSFKSTHLLYTFMYIIIKA